MILILSTSTDYDTLCVVEWLRFYKKEFFRLNDDELMEGDCSVFYDGIDEDKIYLKREGKIVYIKEIKVVWFRKFGFLKNHELKLNRNSDITRYLYSELSRLREILFEVLSDRKWLYKKGNMPTKLEVLRRASYVGLNIPNTIITTSKEELISFFYENDKSIITKSIGSSAKIFWNDKSYFFRTYKIEDVVNIGESFSPSLFQGYIDKEYELRVFYLDGKCYSMAIFSQSNPKTQVDFRLVDFRKLTRFVPYKLPKEIELKIDLLMRNLRLNTGSIDLVKSKKEGCYYFLEVNPAGQFGMASFPCNYNLHQKVADYLIKL
ncbi:grasp-with-spasm system ATP-grasp peptide maturase [Flavobacterium sp. '19STA2R22 D10 B1']|uniref:grasp-with-spasm system ATP-grasp peptide maturase n=1 Tax=Flavobacterium aerium TaxID=3037261 RepID=UPI00278C515E|nr:grasp-with-spasm system ATP-grasp peptide maturase [Flavobacterium sp. '19STA2R22 D10 B1']